MRGLLQEKWNLGPRLADVLLAYYGGHVHLASEALIRLATKLEKFDCESVAPVGMSAYIATCLNTSLDGPRAALVLRDMAKRGFAPIYNDKDSMAQLIAEQNVGGRVESHASVTGTPPHVRTVDGADFGIIPSSHFVRHMISKVLHVKAKANEAAEAEKPCLWALFRRGLSVWSRWSR